MLITINLAVVAKVILGIILFFVALIVISSPKLMFALFELVILWCYMGYAVEEGSIILALCGIGLASILPLMFWGIDKLEKSLSTNNLNRRKS